MENYFYSLPSANRDLTYRGWLLMYQVVAAELIQDNIMCIGQIGQADLAHLIK